MNDRTDPRLAHQPGEQQDDLAPCADSRVVYPSIVESAVQAYPLAVDFERVAVDDPCGAGHIGQGRSGEQA